MASNNPRTTTVFDLCKRALKDAGALGIGQTPLAEDISDAWDSLQWMLQQWERERWLIYHLVTYTVVSDGRITPYLVGPGSPDINTDNVPSNFNAGTSNTIGTTALGYVTSRPNRIEAAFFAQLNSIPQGPVKYPLRVWQSMEDYNKIALPNLTTFSLGCFYNPKIPMGELYVWPWPQGSIYQIGIICREQLPSAYVALNSLISLPYEYYQAIISNLALALRPKYGLGTFPGDLVPGQAKNGLNILRKGNTAITNLVMPKELGRDGLYNIYSDQTY